MSCFSTDIPGTYLISLSYFNIILFWLISVFRKDLFFAKFGKIKKFPKIISVNINPLPKTYLYTLFYQQEEI